MFNRNKPNVITQFFGFVPVTNVPDDYIEVVAIKEKRRGGGKRNWRLRPVDQAIASEIWFEFYPEIKRRSDGHVFPARIHVLWYWDRVYWIESSSFVGGIDILHENREDDVAEMLSFLA